MEFCFVMQNEASKHFLAHWIRDSQAELLTELNDSFKVLLSLSARVSSKAPSFPSCQSRDGTVCFLTHHHPKGICEYDTALAMIPLNLWYFTTEKKGLYVPTTNVNPSPIPEKIGEAFFFRMTDPDFVSQFSIPFFNLALVVQAVYVCFIRRNKITA